MYVKVFGSILDSSVWHESLTTKVLWLTMLVMADEDGVVGASVGGLAKRAGITREECEQGLAVFLAPDPDSRSRAFDGRRIEKVDGGWLVLNHGAYREIRTKRQRREAARQQRHREKIKLNDLAARAPVASATARDKRDSHALSRPSRRIPPNASAPASASDSALAKKEPIPEQELVGREITDPLDAVLAESRLDLTAFSERDAEQVRGFLRMQRSPLAVAQTLAVHLTDEEGPPATPRALAIAVRDYGALAEPNFRALHFAGYVKHAMVQLAAKPSRVQSRNEERFITSADNEAECARREQAEMDRLLAGFERTHEEEYKVLRAQAERMVPSTYKGALRAPVVNSALAKLIREWKP